MIPNHAQVTKRKIVVRVHVKLLKGEAGVDGANL
jgi:hypothetical protein